LDALSVLYNQTNGQNWAWSSVGAQWDFVPGCNPCTEEWQGVTCTLVSSGDPYQFVTALQLANFNLQGRLPASLGNLTLLSKLLLQENSIDGSIPATLSSLVQLTVLDLHVNFLTGTIPDIFGMRLIWKEIFCMGIFHLQ
jgi:hypothetical protein